MRLGFRSAQGLVLGLASGLLITEVSLAATLVSSVSASPDVTVELSSATFDDEDVAVDNLLGIVVPTSLGTLPANADVTAYHLLGSGDQLFSLGTTVTLSGPLTVEPGDVVRYDGSTYSVEFDASANSIPSGVITDAVSRDSGGDLLISFDTTVDLGSFTADDEDLVACQGLGAGVCTSFGSTPVFDGSTVDATLATLDLDGAHDLGNGSLALSFDGSGTLGSVTFDDEDILYYDPVGSPTWDMVYDGSAEHPELDGGPDLNALALPEPNGLLLLVLGIAGLLVLGRGRIQSQR